MSETRAIDTVQVDRHELRAVLTRLESADQEMHLLYPELSIDEQNALKGAYYHVRDAKRVLRRMLA